MTETNNEVTQEPKSNILSRSSIIATMQKYVSQAEERLALLGDNVSKEDVYDAMYERGDHNEPLVTISFTWEYFDKSSLERLRGNTKFTTVNASADFLDIDGYGTLILYFDKAMEASRFLDVLDMYGREVSRAAQDNTEILNGTIAVVPFLLGGEYSLIASNPKQWVPLSQHNEPGVIDEIRIYFDPEEYAIINDNSQDARTLVKEIQSEMAQEEWELQQRERKQRERKEYEAERDKERAELYAKAHEHSFTARGFDKYN